MTGSGIFRLGWADLARGLVLAALTAVLTSCQQAISAGDLDPTAWDWRTIGGVALAAVVGYLLKNLLSTEDHKVLGKIGAFILVLVAAGAVSGCSGLNLGWGAVQQAAPGSAALSIDPACHGQTPSDLPCMSVTGAQNMDSVHVAIGRDGNGRPTFALDASGIDPARNQAIAAQALQQVTQSLSGLMGQMLPLLAASSAAAPSGLTPQGQPRVEVVPQ